MHKFFATLLLAFLGCPALFAQTPDWYTKVDPKLWNYLQQPDTVVEFLVVMQKQADVSGARLLRKKEDKGRYVVDKLASFAESTQRELRDLLDFEGAPFHSFWVVNAIWVKGGAPLIEKIAQMEAVGRIEMNPVWHLSEAPQYDTEIPSNERSAIPWGILKINADDVWNLGFDGTDIVVGGQDTGYEWEHPAIKDRYRGWDGSSVDHDYNWHDAITALINGGANSCGLDLQTPCDDHNHGTHTMGTMVGTETDKIGVAPNAKWMGCRNMEEGDGTPATYIECFEWLMEPTKVDGSDPDVTKAPHVINNSWGCPVSEGCNNGNYATMETTVENVRAAGIVVVVSAGNSGSGCSTVDSPAAIYDASFTVGATSNTDNIAGFSSRGPVTVYTGIMKPDISAPGVDVHSCIGHDNDPGSYAYANWNGTSMAGPHIAGSVALLLDARPALIGDVDAVEQLLTDNAVERFATAPFCGTDNGTAVPNNVYGWGRVDILAAVNAALPVILLRFEARATQHTATLNWFTSSEQNCSRFVVQRSGDGLIWQQIGELECRGNGSDAETPYTFEDKQPLPGLNYYRLEQSDFSGEKNISPVRALSFSQSGYNIRLTSGKGQAYFEVVGEGAREQTWRLEVLTIEGRRLHELSVGSKGWLNIQDAPNGIYTVVLRDATGRAVDTEKWFWLN